MADWHIGTLEKRTQVAENIQALTFLVEGWQKHQPGQHYDIRLTLPNGVQSKRDYSVASPPEEAGIVEFGVELIENGELSPRLWQLPIGGQVELKGPVGAHFVWNISMPGPLILIGGGSGVVPLMSMLRHHAGSGTHGSRDIIFLISARSVRHVPYWEELERIAFADARVKIVRTLTGEQPEGWTGYRRRIDDTMLRELFGHIDHTTVMIYTAGPTSFVDTVASGLETIGFNPHDIRTEKFS
jgi:ferredoxin-NADP reductase